jgi:hypothetical protein
MRTIGIMLPLAISALLQVAPLAPHTAVVPLAQRSGVPEWPLDAHVITVATDGSADHRSIARALEAAEDGTIVDIARGEYVETLVLRKAVWLRATPGAVRVTAIEPAGTALTIDLAEGARVTGLLFSTMGERSPGTVARRATIEVRDARVRFDSAGVASSPISGILVQGESDVVLESALVAAVDSIGVLVEGPARARLVDCDIRHIGHVGVASMQGAQVELSTSRVLYAAFHGMRIDNSTAVVEGSWFEGHGRSQIYFDTDSPARIHGNVFVGARGPMARALRAGGSYGRNCELDAAPGVASAASAWPPQPEEVPWIRAQERRVAIAAGPSIDAASKLSWTWRAALQDEDPQESWAALQAVDTALSSADEVLRLTALLSIPSIPEVHDLTQTADPHRGWRARVLEATRSPHGVVQREAFLALARVGLVAGDRERLVRALEARTPGFDVQVGLLNTYFGGDLTGRAEPFVSEVLAGHDPVVQRMMCYGFKGARVTPAMETRLFELAAGPDPTISDAVRCFALAQLGAKSERVLGWLARESRRDELDLPRLAHFVRTGSTEAEIARIVALGGRLPEAVPEGD